MSQENNNLGAPSSDDTSALFVTARKKQLEEQEAQRKAAEEERRRLDAEAEVRRLEEAVRQRKLEAEEEAKRVEEETRIKREQAAKEAANPTAGFAPAQTAARPAKPAGGGTAVAAKAPMNQKTMIIIGAAAAVVVLVIVLVMVLGGSGSPKLEGVWSGSQGGIAFNYPTGWTSKFNDANDAVTFTSADQTQIISITDVTQTIGAFAAQGIPVGDAAENILDGAFDGIAGASPVSDFTPAVDSGNKDSVTAEGRFTMDDGGTVLGYDLYLRQYGNQFALFVAADIGNKNLDKLAGTVKSMADTASFKRDGDYTEVSAAAEPATFPDPLPGYARFYEPESGVTFEYPTTMSKEDLAGDGAFLVDSNRACLFIVNLTGEYAEWIGEGKNAVQCNREFMQISIDILGNKSLTVSLNNIVDRTDTNDLTVCEFMAAVGQNGIEWYGFSDICYGKTATDEILGYFILYTQDQESENVVNQIIRTMDIVK